MNDSWISLFDHGWIVSSLRPLESPVNPPLVLLHGLSGDENSLKPLVQNFKRNRWILSFRGMLHAEDTGFAWAAAKARDESGFHAAIQGFSDEMKNVMSLLEISTPGIDLLGFSQGAGFAALLLLTFPEMIRNVAFVSGFVPNVSSAFNLPKLSSHRIFISHGIQDDVVPLIEAQHAFDLFSSLGADVTFCKTNTRHKIGAVCLQKLNTFFD